jgi:hypothetical protein
MMAMAFTGKILSVRMFRSRVRFMEKRNIIGIALMVGIVVVISLILWNYQSIAHTKETNQTPQPITAQDVQSDQVMGRLSHSISLEKTLQEKVERIMVYKTVPKHYTRQDILSLAQKFNITPIGQTKEVEEGSSVASVDGRIQAVLHNSGFVEYHNSNRAHTVNPIDIPENLLSDEEAVKIATKFLKDRDLLPEGAFFSGTHHGKIYRLGDNGNKTVVWEDVEVWYGRKLNGNTVEGTQLMLAIGADGTPIEYFTNWRDYELYKELPVKTPDAAFEKLKIKGVPVGMNPTDTEVSIDNVYLTYNTKAGAYKEDYLEPVWVFKGNITSDDHTVTPVKQYIPALTDEAVKSLSSL